MEGNISKKKRERKRIISQKKQRLGNCSQKERTCLCIQSGRGGRCRKKRKKTNRGRWGTLWWPDRISLDVVHRTNWSFSDVPLEHVRLIVNRSVCVHTYTRRDTHTKIQTSPSMTTCMKRRTRFRRRLAISWPLKWNGRNQIRYTVQS